jgi:hypothetical protein
MSKKKTPPAPTARPSRITVALSPEERAQLDAAAAEQGISRADVLRVGFRNYPRPVNGTRRDA